MSRLRPWPLPLLAALALATAANAQQPKTEARFDVVVRSETITARDGTKMAADVYLPAKGSEPLPGKHPTLLTRTPYGKARDAETARWFAARGYAVVANDCRGRFESEGRWRMLLDDPADGADGADVLTWIAARPWSTGTVGTFGTSYEGHRIRVDVSGSNFPRFDANPNTGEPFQRHRRMATADNTVYLGGDRASHVVLPVIPRPAR